MKRENGFYWVKDSSTTINFWIVAYWEDGNFYLPGSAHAWKENFFDEIDENKLTHA